MNVKKGQWVAPAAMEGAVEKLRNAGANEVAVTERGSFFGYGDLVVDMRSFTIIRQSAGVPALFDATHSVQRPQAGGASGNPEHSRGLALAAVAAGCDGLFLETHPEPERAPSDGATMIRLDRLRPLLSDVVRIRETLSEPSASDS